MSVTYSLCFIADYVGKDLDSYLRTIEQALIGGATLVQLRAKKLSTREFASVVELAIKVVEPYRVPLIINDNCDIAMALECDGVHLGRNDFPLEHARALLGEKKLLGASAISPEEAVLAENCGADYIGCGSVFSTRTKRDIRAVIGTAGLARVVQSVRIPVLGIGGIGLDRIASVMQAGAAGAAVSSAISESDDPTLHVRKLMQVIRSASKHHIPEA